MIPLLDLAFDPGALIEPGLDEAHWQQRLAGWLGHLAPELPLHLISPAYSLGLTFTDDVTIAELNARWRDQEGPTDVLAFAAQESPLPLPIGGPSPTLELGDIVISLETASRQAAEVGHGMPTELMFLTSHGLLHLLGWDHPDEASLQAMLARQERLIRG